MIVEQRTYTIHPGKVGTFLQLYQSQGMDVQIRILGRMVGYFTTQFGVLNQIVHLWAYEDLEDRERRRAALFSDPTWLSYFDKVTPLIQKQETTILQPTSFSPIR